MRRISLFAVALMLVGSLAGCVVAPPHRHDHDRWNSHHDGYRGHDHDYGHHH